MQGKKSQFAPFIFLKREMSRFREGKKESFVTVVNNFASAEKKEGKRDIFRFSEKWFFGVFFLVYVRKLDEEIEAREKINTFSGGFYSFRFL